MAQMPDTTNHARSQAGLPISCDIEAQLEYQLEKPILVKGTVHNTGPSAIWVLDWNTFLDPKGQDCLLMAHDGQTVPYTGTKSSFGRPDRGSYVRIAAGRSESRQIDISETYAIKEAGEYQLSFYLPLLGCLEAGGQEPPREDSQYTLTIVESDTVTIRIVDEAPSATKAEDGVLAAPGVSMKFPPYPKPPTFDGLSTQEVENFRNAHAKAYQAILAALASVEKSLDGTWYYSDWFDYKWAWGRANGWEARRQTVIDNYTKMAWWMADGPVHYVKNHKQCTFGVLALTAPDVRSDIFLCPSGALNDDTLRVEFTAPADFGRVFVLIHELSHGAGGTTDDHYLFGICNYLAMFSPGVAVTNAQNYALFAMKQVQRPALPPYGKIFSLRAANNKFLSMRPDGSLIADQDKVTDSEKFVVVDATGYTIALKPLFGNGYVTTDRGTGVLKVDFTEIGQSQTFSWLPQDGRTVALQSGLNAKYVSFKPNSNNTGFADPPNPYAMKDTIGAWEQFQFTEVSSGYRRIKVFKLDDTFLGYLDMKNQSAYCEAVLQSKPENAHRYRWHSGTWPHTGRLDQKTVPDDRSFTYGNPGNYPSWGLAANWIWLYWADATGTIWDLKNQGHRTLCFVDGRGLCFGGPGASAVKLVFDPDDPGVK
jgi:hypothetical protein